MSLKISQFTSTTSANGVDLLPLVQSGQSKYATLNKVMSIPIFSVYANATTTSSSNSWAKIPFNTVEVDTNNFFDTVNYRFLPLIPGTYHIECMVRYSQSASGGLTTYLHIYKNGSNYHGISQLMNYNGNYNQTLRLVTKVALNGSTDYLEGWFRAGGSTATTEANANTTCISGFWIHP